MPLPKAVLLKYKNEVFVETGTLNGEAVSTALDCGFKQAISIDIDGNLIAAQKQKYGANPNTSFYCGSSGVLLLGAISRVTGRITFWLDAHPPGNPLPMSSTPLLAEVAAIKAYSEKLPADKLPTILIDDMRIFSAEDKNELMRAVNDCFKGVLSFEDNGIAPDDILVYKPV